MARLAVALEQLELARAYTLEILEQIDVADYFRQPTEGVTHIGWQVGHLAMADYRLLLERVRGPKPEDETLISADFLKRFGRNSVPDPDPAANPTPVVLLETLHRVRAAGMQVVAQLSEAELEAPPHTPHRLFDTRFGALTWNVRHEMVHAGQIALIRRLLGAKPIW